MDCSLPGSSVHRVTQARILEWVFISFSRGYSWPRDRTFISCAGRQALYHWATWETRWNFRHQTDRARPGQRELSLYLPERQWPPFSLCAFSHLMLLVELKMKSQPGNSLKRKTRHGPWPGRRKLVIRRLRGHLRPYKASWALGRIWVCSLQIMGSLTRDFWWRGRDEWYNQVCFFFFNLI